METYKVMNWNIAQATNKNGTNRIADLVGETIGEHNPDLLVLTEFCDCKNSEVFLEQLSQKGYDWYTRKEKYSKYNHQNKILLAWKRELFSPTGEAPMHSYTNWTNNIPNFARMTLESKPGSRLTLAGMRITMGSKIKSPKRAGDKSLEQQYQEQATLRKKQMEYVMEKLSDCDRVLLTGDFNNYRKGTTCIDWNIGKLNCADESYRVFTPEGQSIHEEKARSREYEFAEDHFLAKGCSVENYVYNRDFVKRCPQIYAEGKDFSTTRIVNGKLKIDWCVPVGIGFPDHAVLLGELIIGDKEV